MIYCVIQARIGSTRLPGKVMMNIQGYPVIWHVVNRVRESRLINDVIVATSSSEKDKELVEFLEKNNISFYTGSEEDVLDRYYKSVSSRCTQEDVIVRVTGDCPLIDPEIIDEVIRTFQITGADYASNTNPPTFPDGLDVEVFKFSALETVHQKARLPSEREHVTPYLRNHPELFKVSNYTCDKDYSGLRWTLDEKEDFILIDKIFSELDLLKTRGKMKDIIRFIESRPEILKINDKFTRNEGFLKSLLKDKEVEKANI